MRTEGEARPMEEALRLLQRFVDRTGVVSGPPGTRYLWTDAFAVCTFIGLGRATGDRRYVDRGLRLIPMASTRSSANIGSTTIARVG